MEPCRRRSPQAPSMAAAASSPSPHSPKDSELSMDSTSSPTSSSRSASETSSSNGAGQGLRRRSRAGEQKQRAETTLGGGRTPEALRNGEMLRNGRGLETPRSRNVLEASRNGRGLETPRIGPAAMVGRDQKINSYGHGHGHGHADDDKEMPAVRSFHGSMCCKCAAGFTADCAAVCCCPLALLHLAAMALIRLPSAMAWKMIVNLKNKSCLKSKKQKKEKDKKKQKKPKKKERRAAEEAGKEEGEREGEGSGSDFDSESSDDDGDDDDDDGDDDPARSPWARGSPAIEDLISRPICPALQLHQDFHHRHGLQLVSFDSENLFRHFQTEQVDFGGFVHKIG